MHWSKDAVSGYAILRSAGTPILSRFEVLACLSLPIFLSVEPDGRDERLGHPRLTEGGQPYLDTRTRAPTRPYQRQLGEHAVLPLPRDSYVVTRSRPYPLKVLAVIVLHPTHSALYAALYAVLNSVLRTYGSPHVPVSPCPRVPGGS